MDVKELTRRVRKLESRLAEGKLGFATFQLERDFRESFSKLRFDQDGNVLPNSVDGRIRSSALAITVMEDREEAKNAISLRDIQFRYFEFIEGHFGLVQDAMKKVKANPYTFARFISKDPKRAKEVSDMLPEFLGALKNFWKIALDPTSIHLEDISGRKAAFGGDLFPSYTKNIASSAGLYLDTIILPDPFLRTGQMWEIWSEQQRCYFAIKHALNVLQYRSLALAQLDTPIVAVLPDRFGLEPEEQRFVQRIGDLDVAKHLGFIFGVEFNDTEEARKFLESFSSVEELLNAVRHKERILFDIEWTGSLDEQFHRVYKEQNYAEVLGEFHAGRILYFCATGRMHQANDLVLKAKGLGAEPILDAPTSWKYLEWKYRYDIENYLAGPDFLLTAGLQNASERVRWLGNIPPKRLVEIRRAGALDEIRGIISSGFDEIEKLDPHDFKSSGDRIIKNIQDAFGRQEKEIEKLKEKNWEFIKDIGMWMVSGSIEVAAAVNGTPAYGLLAFATKELTSIPKLRDVPNIAKELKAKHKEINSSPIAMLMNIRKEAQEIVDE